MKYSDETLEQVRSAVAVVTRNDMTHFKPEDDLSLDSISRIALIPELENAFDIEISQEEMLPEIFKSLTTIASFIEGIRQ
jgi:acyl carrier protein